MRVEKDRLLCFMNGEQVMDVLDTGLRGGKVGLCKFRQTKAEYRSFHWGNDLADKPISAEVKAKLIENTQAAVERGAFGSPTFFVGKEMFFGKEQLREVEEMVSGK